MNNSSATTFANHRGVVPMLWAFFGIATLEMVVVHLFVALKWPWIGWPLTIASALSIIWLVGWIRSWPRLPHRLQDGVLTLHMGSLRHYAVPLDRIARVLTQVTQDGVKAKRTANLVPIAFPNRIVELTEPFPGRRSITRLAIRPDDPAAFDAAMRAAGVPVA